MMVRPKGSKGLGTQLWLGVHLACLSRLLHLQASPVSPFVAPRHQGCSLRNTVMQPRMLSEADPSSGWELWVSQLGPPLGFLPGPSLGALEWASQASKEWRGSE